MLPGTRVEYEAAAVLWDAVVRAIDDAALLQPSARLVRDGNQHELRRRSGGEALEQRYRSLGVGGAIERGEHLHAPIVPLNRPTVTIVRAVPR